MFNLSRRLTYRWKLRIMKKQVKTNIRHLDYGSGDKSFVNFLVKIRYFEEVRMNEQVKDYEK